MIENLQQQVEVDEPVLHAMEAVICSIQQEYGLLSSEVYVMICDEQTISELNKQHRQVDSVTDVLSFPMTDFTEKKPEFEINPETGRVMLGDIVICAQRAADQASEYSHSFKREMAFLTAHGMLHLLGFDHMTEEQEQRMIKRQKAVLKRLKLTRSVE
ncbi:MAG: rRNA maturation RNase YbeY [Christensenellales bacterium]|jgi:probable rRNA maturation factor